MGGGGGGGSRGGNFRPRNRPRNNQEQNRQFKEVVRQLELNKKQQRELHDYISKEFDIGFGELLQIAKDFFGLE